MVIILPRTGRSPFQLYLMGLLTLSGLAMMSGISHSPITDAMGKTSTYVWGAFLFLGGFSSLLGVYWPRNPVTGMLIERTGVVALGGSSFIWSVLVVWRVHLDGLFSSALTFALFLACLAQWRWINKNVNIVMKAIHDK
jgi:hypothetical protein